MKKLLLFILIIASVECFGQIKVSYKNYSDTSGNYIIKYRYNSSVATVHNNKLHYEARIIVYRIRPTDTVGVGQTFLGNYVAENCTDDNPADRIKYAKISKDNK